MITISITASVHVIDEGLAFLNIRGNDCPSSCDVGRAGFFDLSKLSGGCSLITMKELLDVDLFKGPDLRETVDGI